MAEAEAPAGTPASTEAPAGETKTDTTFSVPSGDKPADKPDESDVPAKEADKPGEKADDAPADNKVAKSLWEPEKQPLKLPDGSITDPALMTEFQAFAKANQLTHEQAQAAADLHLKSVSVFAQKLQAEAQATVKGWADEITNDKELGGAKVKETIATAEKYFALAEQVPGVNINRLKADMVRTGMANHPDMIRVSRFIGQHLGDDNLFISDRSTGGGPTDVATILYGEQGVVQK